MGVINLTARDRNTLANRYDENKRTFERVLMRDLRAFFSSMADDLFAQLNVNGRPVDFDSYTEELSNILKKSYRSTGAFFSSHMQRLLKETEAKNPKAEEEIKQLQEERSNIEALLLLLLLPQYQRQSKQQAQLIIDATKRMYRVIDLDTFADSMRRSIPFTSAETAQRISKEFIERNKKRVVTIAENEVGDIAQLSKHAEAKEFSRRLAQLGLILEPTKTWVTVGDERVRDAHRNANRQKRNLDELYLVGGELLEYPKDMRHGASIGNTINCRCDSIPEV